MPTPALPDAENSKNSVPAGEGHRSSRLWPALLISVFLGAGVLLAVQVGSTGAPPEDEFEQLTIELADHSAALETPPTEMGGFGESLASMVGHDAVAAADHPLDPLLALADEGLKRIDQAMVDYTATIISQVRWNGNIQPERRIFCKLRHARPAPATAATSEAHEDAVPFSIYLKMLSPSSVAGQEVIWVDGQNDNKLIAHASGMLNLKRVYLDPTGSMAMKGSRYPIYDIGFRNLIEKMGVVGRRDRLHDDCAVDVTRDVEINGRICTRVEVRHDQQQPHFEFHLVKIYIDQELDVLVGYEGYLWPEQLGGEPVLLEKYFYTDLKINVGLTDEDFSPANKAYEYPVW